MKNLLLTIFLIIILSHNSYSQNWQYYDSLRTVYLNKQSFDTALVYGEKSLNIVKELVGEYDTLYANMLIALVEINFYLRKYSKAIEYGEKEIEIRKIKTGTNNYTYINSCEWLGMLYKIAGNFATAEFLLTEGMKKSKLVLGEKHPEYAKAINNLSGLYFETDNYSACLPLQIESKNIYKETLGEDDPDYAQSLHNLACLYKEMNNLSAAEPLFLEAEKKYRKIYGENHQAYAHPLGGLALLYMEMGNFSLSESYFKKVITIRKNALGENSPDYAISLNNLANLYLRTEEYNLAEPLFIKSKNIWRTVLGENHPNYSYSLNNLAVLYMKMDKYDLAKPLLIESKNIRQKILGVNHPIYAGTIENLGSLEFELKNYEEAITLLSEAVNIFKMNYGSKSIECASSLHNLAQIYSKLENYKDAEPLFDESLEIVNNSIRKNFTFMSEKEKELYFNTKSDKFSEFYSFAIRSVNKNKTVSEKVYNNIIKNKGLLLKSSALMRSSIFNSNDTNLITKYNRWISLNKEITKLYSQPINKRNIKPEEIENTANLLEKEIINRSQFFCDYEKHYETTWDSIKNHLKNGEAAIEFVRYKENPKKNVTQYSALLITPDCKYPEMIKLCNEKDLELIIGNNAKNNLSNVNKLYGTRESPNEQLFKLIWQPLEKFLSGINTVYYAPDGLLHKISFSSIAVYKNHFLCDKYSLKLVSSTTKVAFPEIENLNQNIFAEIYGGIEYSDDSVIEKIWQYLPGTKNETEKINKQFQLNKIKSKYFSGMNADEKEFKNTAGSANIIHIATHGFFYPEPKTSKKDSIPDKKKSENSLAIRGGTSGFGVWQFVMNKNPLMRTGLVFAKANAVWNQKYAVEGEDGVLTAQEVTQLDLHKTQLVVLSACETGLGDIKGSEGVYGLQRAFKMVGVKFLIMSLWQVPDKETSEFMAKFYEKMLFSKDIRKSFNETQTEMRRKYDPFYWGAFVLIE